MHQPPIDLSPLHPVMQQALAPFVLSPADRKLAADFAGPDDIPVEWTSAAFHKANDARALRLQMARPQTVEGFFI